MGGRRALGPVDPREALNTFADIVATSLASAAFALAAYLLCIGWQDGEGTYCTVRHPCDDPLADFQFRFVAFIVTLAVGAAIAAWTGRAFVATVSLIVVPLATTQVNGDVSDVDPEATGLFQLALLGLVVPVIVAVAIVTAIVARSSDREPSFRSRHRPPLGCQ